MWKFVDFGMSYNYDKEDLSFCVMTFFYEKFHLTYFEFLFCKHIEKKSLITISSCIDCK